MEDNNIFDQYRKLLIPEEIVGLDNDIKTLSKETNIGERYSHIYNNFENASKLNKSISKEMKMRQDIFKAKYNNLRKDYKKIYFITELTKELQDNINEWFIVARTRGKFGAKINMVIDTNEYGTQVRFPALVYYTPYEFDPLSCRDTKDIKLQMFRIQYYEKIKECVDKHKENIKPYIEQMNNLFNETNLENSKYFILTELGD